MKEKIKSKINLTVIKKEKGITLIALVVTIVVLLILAGVTIVVLFGDNGIIKQAEEATNSYGKEAVREKIENVKANWITKKALDNTIKVNPDFWNDLIKAEIIENIENDVKPNGEEGNLKKYEVTTKDGYVVEILIDENENITIGQIEKGNATPKVLVKNITRDSIEIEVKGAPAGTSYQYEYKKQTEETYKTVTGESNNCTFTGLENGTIYDIKVTMTRDELNLEPIEIQETTKPGPGIEFSRSNGEIDVKFINNQNKIITTIPTPTIGNEMIPVTYKNDAWYVCNTTDTDWYSYTEEKKQWANVMLKDGLQVEGITDVNVASIGEMAGKKVTAIGSMFVYIPRYAYKITYSETNGTILGYSNSDGIVDNKGGIIEGTEKYNKPGDSTSGLLNPIGDKYILHPAFDYNGAKEGIWVAKYEASHTECTTELASGAYNGIEKTLQVKPGVTSWRCVSIGNMYDVCLQYKEHLNSHMMKNSEWGAVAYFAESKYGINVAEMAYNDNRNYVTGEGGITANTTGNEYGIYDMSGGSNEYVAAYAFPNANNSLQSETVGKSLIEGEPWTKNIYELGIKDYDTGVPYELCKKIYGDAMYETSERAGATGYALSWHAKYSTSPYYGAPAFLRGGNSYNGTESISTYKIGAGLYTFRNFDGVAYSSTAGKPGSLYTNCSFRPVLIP